MISYKKKTPDIREVWGYKFEWTDLHHSAAQLRPLMFTYDKLADDCLQRLNEISPPKHVRQAETSDEMPTSNPSRRDLYALLKEYHDEDPKLGEFWAQINTVPHWVDWEQIKRGQDVFYRYGMSMLNVLTFQSLLGGMGASRVVETLSRTGGFSADRARRRMLETLQHVLQVVQSVESLKPGGAGQISSVRVRLLHAAVRSRILSLEKHKPEYYDTDKFGIPINDLDCIGTINIFSTSVVWAGLPRQGIWPRNQEIVDYLALWRLVGYYMGTPHDCLSSTAKAKVMMESLLMSEINPTTTGQTLAQNIILSLENTAPTYASKEFLEAMARHLNGHQLSDELGIPQPSLYYRALIYGHCVVAMWFAYAFRPFPFLDQALINLRRRRYYSIITDKDRGLGKETIFEFKYVPLYTRTTRLGKRKNSGQAKHGVELLAHIGLIIAAVTVVGIFGGLLFVVRQMSSELLWHFGG